VKVFQFVPHPAKKYSGYSQSAQYQRLSAFGCHKHKGQRMRLKFVVSASDFAVLVVSLVFEVSLKKQ
jgi:hypothetical protein